MSGQVGSQTDNSFLVLFFKKELLFLAFTPTNTTTETTAFRQNFDAANRDGATRATAARNRRSDRWK